MKFKNFIYFALGAVTSGVICIFLFREGLKMTKVHTLEMPLLLLSNESTKNFHFLPVGTTLYFDKSLPEGVTRYKVYINIDRMPLQLHNLADSTEIDPIEARSLSKSELSRVLHDYPLSRYELEAILRSRYLNKNEVKEVFDDYLSASK